MTPESEDAAISHWIDVSSLGAGGQDFTVTFDQAALDVLTGRLDVLSVSGVRAEGRVWPAEDGVFVDFRLTGHVEQTCVVTLDPVGSDVDERVSLHYTPASSAPAGSAVIDIGDEDDPPEIMVDDRVDIGAAMAEHLALALDPWPRKPGAELPAGEGGDEDRRENPFAVLAELKTKLEDKGPED